MLVTKLLGIGCVILGLATIIFVPGAGTHQPPQMTNAIILIGILILAFGIFLFTV